MSYLKTVLTMALVAFTLFFNSNPAKAAVSDCASQGCFPVCTNAGPVEMYFKADGSHAGTINGVGTGGCRVFADEGYLIITRTTDTTVRIYNVQSESLCSLDTGTGMTYGLVFGSHAYVTSTGDLVKKIALDCSSSQDIAVGSSPTGITKDSNTIYVVNTASSNISTIVPPATTSTTYGIGRVAGDGLQAIKYHSGTNALYISGSAGVYKADLPLGTSALWQPISGGISTLDMNSTYVVVPSMPNNLAYLIDIANPTTDASVSCTACRSVAISDDTFYTVGGNVPDVGAKAWDFSLNQKSYSPVTTDNSRWVTYLAPTVTPPSCPNGIKEGTEECDGTQFGTATCQSLGFDGGSLSCTGTCTISTSACFYNCGNGSIESPEECDGSNLNGQDCTDLGFDSGTLSCNASCEFVTTQCVTLTCGNSQIDSGEDCDGANLNGSTCQTLGFTGGTLSCSPTSCTFDTSACTTNLCGNGAIDDGEECDGINLGSATCQSQGFDGGSLSCSGSCEFNTTGCTLNTCGNGVIDTNEECDDDNTNAGDGCGGNCQIEDGYACEGQPSTCTLVEEPCNQDGLVEVVTSISHPDLAGAALEQYQISSALPKGSTITCETAFGVDVIKIQVPAGHHANVRIQTSTMEVVWHLYDGATLLVPVENPSLMNRIGGGDIFLHSGSDIEAKYESLGLGTLGTAGMNRFLSSNPLTGASGNWLEVRVTTDRIRLFAIEDAGNTVTLAAPEMDAPIYVNLDALGDLSKIFPPTTKPPKGCGGCSTSGNGSSSLPIAFLSVLALFVIRRRKVSGSN